MGELEEKTLPKSDTPLRIIINPGEAPPEEIAYLLSKLSRLYKKLGGSGIKFTPETIHQY